jgi:hypothetical protein
MNITTDILTPTTDILTPTTDILTPTTDILTPTTDILTHIIYKHNYTYNLTIESNEISIIFIKSKYSSIRPDQYCDMINEIIYNDYIYNNYNSKLNDLKLSLFIKNKI